MTVTSSFSKNLKNIKRKSVNLSDLDGLLVNSESFSQLFIQRTTKKWINYVVQRISKSPTHMRNLIRILSDYIVNERHPEWVRHALTWIECIGKITPHIFLENAKVIEYVKKISNFNTEIYGLMPKYDSAASRGEAIINWSSSLKQFNKIEEQSSALPGNLVKFNYIFVDDSDDDFGDIELKQSRSKLSRLRRFHSHRRQQQFTLDELKTQKALSKDDSKHEIDNKTSEESQSEAEVEIGTDEDDLILDDDEDERFIGNIGEYIDDEALSVDEEDDDEDESVDDGVFDVNESGVEDSSEQGSVGSEDEGRQNEEEDDDDDDGNDHRDLSKKFKKMSEQDEDMDDLNEAIDAATSASEEVDDEEAELEMLMWARDSASENEDEGDEKTETQATANVNPKRRKSESGHDSHTPEKKRRNSTRFGKK